jgi:hypothetical protein
VQRDAVKILSPAGVEYATYEDLSVGGLKLWLDHEMLPPTTIRLEFSLRPALQGSTPIKVLGRVVRCLPSKLGFEIGVQFIGLDPTTQSAMEKLFDLSEGPF